MPSAGRGDRTDFGTGSPRRRRQEYFCRRFFIERIRRGVSWTVALFPNGCSAFSLFSFACSLFRLSGLSPFRCRSSLGCFPCAFFSGRILFPVFILPSSFGSAFPVSGFRLRLVLSRIIRLHVWRYVSRRGLRGTTMPTAQAVPVAHAAASADRAEPENRPERPLPSGPKLRAAAASVLPSGGRIPVVLLASGASVCRLRQERRRQSGMVRFQRLKAVP